MSDIFFPMSGGRFLCSIAAWILLCSGLSVHGLQKRKSTASFVETVLVFYSCANEYSS